jgi:glycosyltransferase involved in cell wall biosynthesis
MPSMNAKSPDLAERLRIAILAAGAAGMYCGSCIRDNQLALALKRLGHDVVMIPLYTPVKTDVENASINTVFYGGVNTWLQHANKLFRKTPRALDWLLDRPRLLTLAGNYGAQTSPSKLGDFTLDILRGETGNTSKELRRLIDFLKTDLKPQVISLPNLMFIGAARLLKQELNTPIVCELTGEDIFLNAMSEPHRSQAQQIIRERAQDVDRFVSTSRYYAREMANYLNVPEDQIDVVYPGLPEDYLQPAIGKRQSAIPTVGYLARICPEKGIDQLVDGMFLLKKRKGFENVKLKAAGYLGKAHTKWYADLERRIRSSPLKNDYTYLGEVDRATKLHLLDTIDVLAVPTAYPESKGLYVLESLARATPVVLPHHGSFPELIAQTGGGITHPPGNPAALADALAAMLSDPAQRKRHGEAGRAAVRDRFLDTHMANDMLQVFRSALGPGQPHPGQELPRTNADARG